MDTLERKVLAALFFLFGVEIIAWVPRFPEVKDNLGLSKGQFGTLLSASVIGSVIGLLTVGHIVHRFGTEKILVLSSTAFLIALIAIVHVSNSWHFLLCNILYGGSISAFHIAINGQAFHEQEKTKSNLIPRLHGFWAFGALATAIVSGFLVGKVSLTAHIDFLAVLCYLLILILIRKISPDLVAGIKGGEYSPGTLFSSFSVDRIASIGLICVAMAELGTADWSTIFSKEDLHMSPGVAAIPYILFMFAVILGRLGIHRLPLQKDFGRFAQKSVLFGGGFSVASILIAVRVAETMPTFGFAIYALGTFIAGLSSSFLTPAFMIAGIGRSKAPSAVIIGQLGVINTLLIFFCKAIIAWTAQLTSISIALLIPGLLLMCTASATKILKNIEI
ncbi:MAG: MFS transporter [Actinobacteria bacterium]|nr:MFS transporter [Actinomycetota bacterium]